MDGVDAPGLATGSRIGRFVIVRQLGAGGMGTVYEARDPELERSVALKLLQNNSPVMSMRLLREAQVLAQLQHPNVVAVHTLDLHADQVVIAMELVDGETLDCYIERTKPDWRGIVALFAQAGRGLVAAHAKGIIHRDVKPSNLFVDESGRVRVGDFGLARQIADDESEDRVAPVAPMAPADRDAETVSDEDAPPLDTPAILKASPAGLIGSPLTRTGALLGTPYFMAPEQHRGRKATAATDQFGLCVAMWLALFDEHPFALERGGGKAVIEGRRAPTPSGKAPRWLVRALDRGLEVDPANRHPSVAALVSILESHPARRRRLAIAGVAGLLVAGAAVWVFAGGRAAEADPCPAPDTRVATVWSAPRSAELETHLAAIDPVEGAARFAAVTRTIDPFVETFREAYVTTCEATRVHGGQSDSMFDARMRCLDQRLDELAVGVEALAAAPDAKSLDGAIGSLVHLTPVALCSDPSALAADLASPIKPEQRAIADELDRRIRRLTVTAGADWKSNLPAKATTAVADARKLGHPPTLIAALSALAQIELGANHSQAGEAVLREMTQVAAGAHDDRSEAFAWIKLVGVVGANRAKPVEGLALAPAASAAILRAGNPMELRVDLLYAESMVIDLGPDVPQAIAKLAAARKLLEDAGAKDPASPWASRLADVWLETGSALALSGDFDGASTAFHEAIKLDQALLGPDSVDEAYAWNNLGEAMKNAGKLEVALPAAETAVRIREARTGQSAMLASALVTLGTIEGTREHWDAALKNYERAFKIFRVELGPDDIQLASVLLGKAWALGGLDRHDEEVRGYDEVIALFARTKSSSLDLGAAYLNRGEVFAQRARYVDALADYVHSVAAFEAQVGPRSPYLATPLLGQGRCLVLMSKPADAITPLEHAIELAEKDGVIAVSSQAWLGRALIASGRDQARGTKLVREARVALAGLAKSDGSAKEELKDLERWLARMKLR